MNVPMVLLPKAFGVLMVGAAAQRADGAALGVAAVAVVAVVAAAWVRPMATVAVLLTVATVVLATPAPMFAALSGLSATAYLVLRHGRACATAPTMIAAVGFTAAAAFAAAVPLEVAWLPLAAPLALLAAYLLALRPYLGGQLQIRTRRSGSRKSSSSSPTSNAW